MQLTVQTKQPGKRQNQITQTTLSLDMNPSTIQELLDFTVRACVRDFISRQESGDYLLDEDQITDRSSAGKIGFGFFYGGTDIDEAKAVCTALEAFSDGLVTIFIDGDRYEQLSAPIALTESSIITFVKLTMLTGRLW